MIPAFASILTIAFVALSPLLTVALRSNSIQSADDACTQTKDEDWATTSFEGEVAGVIDGNTFIIILANRERKRVRIVNIEAPRFDQPFGIGAKTNLTRLVTANRVTILLHNSYFEGSLARDEVSAQVVVQRGKNRVDIGLSQIQAGVALYDGSGHDTLPENEKCLYRRAQLEARRERRGMWADAPTR